MAITIDPIRLEPSPTLKISGGPTFSTQVTPMKNGFRVANQEWPEALWKLTVAFVAEGEEFRQLLTHFLGVRGAAYPFLIKDPYDHDDWGWGKVALHNGVYRLVKEYPYPGRPYVRVIQRPIEGTVDLSLVPGATGIDYTTGIVSGATEEGPATFEFDLIVNFNSDSCNYDFYAAGYAEWSSIELNEVRVK